MTTGNTTDFQKQIEDLSSEAAKDPHVKDLRKKKAQEEAGFSIKDASVHLACSKLLQDRIKNAETIFLATYFDDSVNAACVYVNDKLMLPGVTDSICLWRATSAKENTLRTAEGVAGVVANLLIILGYNVNLDGVQDLTPGSSKLFAGMQSFLNRKSK